MRKIQNGVNLSCQPLAESSSSSATLTVKRAPTCRKLVKKKEQVSIKQDQKNMQTIFDTTSHTNVYMDSTLAIFGTTCDRQCYLI